MLAKLKTVAVAAALAGAFTIAVPMGTASAITTPPCGDPDFVQIWGHNGDTLCFANSGEWDFVPNGTAACWWAWKISTGNNKIEFWDTTRADSGTIIDRNTVEVFPTVGWVCVGALRIF